MRGRFANPLRECPIVCFVRLGGADNPQGRAKLASFVAMSALGDVYRGVMTKLGAWPPPEVTLASPELLRRVK
jgi:hypothetical protein